MTTPFADRLIDRCRDLGHPLCVGLDPHLDRLPELFRQGSMDPRDASTAAAVEVFFRAILERLAGRVAIVKPQIAFFEQLGFAGLAVLDRLVEQARRAGLMVLLDAKRGDIGSTATAYARAYLGQDAALPCDAITLNPYLGLDSLAPFIERAQEAHAGFFVLVKTSNPGSGDYQNRALETGNGHAGGPLFEHVARSLADACQALRGPETGWSSLGVVVGATYPGESEAVRELLPHALFLVPGYGAQGGSAADAVRGFVPGPDGRLEGGIVNSSRGILFPPDAADTDASGWERAIDRAIDRAIEDLSSAVSPQGGP